MDAHPCLPDSARLVLLGKRVRLRLIVRKYFCDQADCPQHIFCERLPTVARHWERTTARLDTQCHQVGLKVLRGFWPS
ncbi:hypothetical protein MF271_00990 (plasmid) [Deinococcus sp. KNUC1210]|uniref:hypothetical protein n=1 Tax=Deinococcus sp. KNUC1210 TaxID=2917691 RepID=UPI001EF013FF|nr:hypothetical protein [Deinococcus sp. KNUC1210]ULH13937.1 hypothetical protein MF271_00990 [Deinococcus sp. KNUC1210]